MTTPATPLTTEQKILAAIEESNQIVTAFSPVAGAVIATGVQAEPVISGVVHMIQGIFKHHTGSASHPAQNPVVSSLAVAIEKAQEAALANAVAKAQAAVKAKA